MGHSIPNWKGAVDLHDGTSWITLEVSLGSPASHHGICLGAASSSAARIHRPAALIAAAETSQSALETAVHALPTINSGPFAGVDPGDWYDGLTSAEKTSLRDLLLLHAGQSRVF
jgi:hypothetical protein